MNAGRTGGTTASRPVRVHVASFNTRSATELCIRSMRATAGVPFTLTVGDSGSMDGSANMLRSLAARGWLRFETQPGRQHADWLNDWIRREDDGYAVFSDSDMQYLRPGWLTELRATADASGAAVVYAEQTEEVPGFVHPRTREVVRLAARPAPWLFLVAVRQVRDVDVSFHEDSEPTPAVPEGVIVYDVGARFFRGVEERGLALIQMPSSFTRSYRHYGGLSWIYEGDYARQKKRDRRLVARRLRYVTLAQSDARAPAVTLKIVTEASAGMSLVALKMRRLRHPGRALHRASEISRALAHDTAHAVVRRATGLPPFR